MPTAFTIGYAGHDAATLVAALQQAGIECVADVRLLPLSRKPGLSKTALASRLDNAGISYVHLKELGTPREVRREYHASHDVGVLRRGYERHLATVPHALDELADLADQKRVALLCVEETPAACHRGILAERLADAGFTVVHLPPARPAGTP